MMQRWLLSVVSQELALIRDYLIQTFLVAAAGIGSSAELELPEQPDCRERL